ncbi:MAG: replication factor C small subunit, partial [Candidatus Aenigmarchaeota archaeon]|nr:replication factor C small subunit [Candidatus Aenigmarchaeota archaeon]
IGKDEVYTVAASMRPEEVKKILALALEKKFLDARKILAELMLERGLSGIDVIKAFHKEILDAPVEEKQKAELIDKLGEYEFRIVEGGSEDLQIEAFLAQIAAIEKK